MKARHLTFVLAVVLGAILAFNLTPHRIIMINLTDQQLYEELVAIDDIGPVLAQRSVIYRLTHPDASPADLEKVDGIGEKKINLIKKRFK